eukprot:NODE_6743_length_487_cov_1.655093.p3 GENE.NODE_6743_length_487_cov_1.655093~~NODE_6743_length_487_cov_1.655093.p3  ORF type:complete len:96 (+),score=6.20 NODE_6743_length_487_cov_1.655093:2-289(+)
MLCVDSDAIGASHSREACKEDIGWCLGRVVRFGGHRRSAILSSYLDTQAPKVQGIPVRCANKIKVDVLVVCRALAADSGAEGARHFCEACKEDLG